MHSRDLDSPPAAPTYPDLVLRTPPNWTAVGFVALLAALHLSVAGRAFLAGRWEGYVSLLFGTLLTVATVVLFHVRREVAVLYQTGKLRVRTGVGRCRVERFIPFASVRAVRVTLGPRGNPSDSRVELICHREDVLCPPTPVPRQLGLLLVMMIDVPLVKVSGDDGAAAPLASGAGAREATPAARQADQSAAG